MRKPYFLVAVAIFVCTLVLLLASPTSKTIFQTIINSSDLLFPFAVYRSMLDSASRPDWIFGGYTPFLELLLGFMLWLPTRSIPATIFLYSLIQPVLVAFSLFELGKRMVGINWKLFAQLLVCLSVGILAYVRSALPFYFFLFSWYMHISTFCLVMIALGLLVQSLTNTSAQRAGWLRPLVWLCAVCAVATLSDALFLSQFIAPAVLLTLLMLAARVIPFRRGAGGILAVLYSSAAGLAMFRLPVLWGADRFSLGGVYLDTKLERILTHIPEVLGKLASMWQGSVVLVMIWFGFYLLCATFSVRVLFRPHQRSTSIIRKRFAAVLAFFVLQIPTTLAAGLLSVEPAVRYLLPVLFTPFLLGWPLLWFTQPGTIKNISRKPIFAGGLLVFMAALAWITMQAGPFSLSRDHWVSYPDYVRCLDENAARTHLRRGMAQYWLARPFTLLSKKGLRVVAVDVNLMPNPVLNNSDGYDQDFDFIVVDGASPNGDPLNNGMIRRETVLAAFGEPAASFICAPNEILIYNRTSDEKFRTWFGRQAADLSD